MHQSSPGLSHMPPFYSTRTCTEDFVSNFPKSGNASLHDPRGHHLQCSKATAGASSDLLPSLAIRHRNVVSSAMEGVTGKRGLRAPK